MLLFSLYLFHIAVLAVADNLFGLHRLDPNTKRFKRKLILTQTPPHIFFIFFCILCVCVKRNKRSLEPFCVWILF